MMTPQQAALRLYSQTCSVCLKPKVKHDPFCASCLTHLPAHMREPLHLPIGQGFELAYEQAGRCIAQRRVSAGMSAPGTDRERLEMARQREALRREQTAKR